MTNETAILLDELELNDPTDLVDYRGRIEEIRDEIYGLEGTVDELKEERDALKKERDEIQARHDALLAERDTIKERADEVLRDLANASTAYVRGLKEGRDAGYLTSDTIDFNQAVIDAETFINTSAEDVQ